MFLDMHSQRAKSNIQMRVWWYFKILANKFWSFDKSCCQYSKRVSKLLPQKEVWNWLLALKEKEFAVLKQTFICAKILGKCFFKEYLDEKRFKRIE